MPEQEATLKDYMKTLFEAGFDVQTVLEKGYQYSDSGTPAMYHAARQVLEVARYLCIDREHQFKASQEAGHIQMSIDDKVFARALIDGYEASRK